MLGSEATTSGPGARPPEAPMQSDSNHLESVHDLTDQVRAQVKATDRLLDQAGERISNAAAQLVERPDEVGEIAA